MNEKRAEHLKTLIRHSTKAELKLPKQFFTNTPCSIKMNKKRTNIKQAITELEKDGKVNISIEKGERYYTIKMKAE